MATSAAFGAAADAAGSAPTCPAADAPVLERFISADCPACWAAPGAAAPQPAGWLFDWIVPTAQGAAAPLAAAALVEAGERAQRAGASGLTAEHGWMQRGRLQRRPGLRLSVIAGPAWNGYFALQLEARGTLAAQATGWMALVEILPAGTDGSPLARELVRSVAGPLPLRTMRADQPLTHLHALRWPDGAQPTRLQARAWIEADDGTLLALASEDCPLR